jgi:hypothetical protein
MKKVQSRVYRKIYEEHHNIKIPKGMHIHHLDGNRQNNNPKNLIMVTPEEHRNIHLKQGDPVGLNGKFINGAAKAGSIGGKARTQKKIKACSENMKKNRRADIGALASVEARRKNKTYFFSKKYQKQLKQKLIKECRGPYSSEHKEHVKQLGLSKGKKPKHNDKIWNSSYDAGLELNIPASTVRYRARNNILGWSYVNNYDKQQ